MNTPDSAPYQYEREVFYAVEQGSFATRDYERREESWLSDELPQVRDRRLRLALELADTVQALGFFPSPKSGGHPGGVTAIPRPKGCVVRQRDEYSAIYTDFPDDTMMRLRQWLDENHQHLHTGS